MIARINDLDGLKKKLNDINSTFLMVLKADELDEEELTFSPIIEKNVLSVKIHKPKAGFPETYEFTIPQFKTFLRDSAKKRKKKQGMSEYEIDPDRPTK